MVPLHFHHGDEFHLVLSGEWAAQVEGKPDHIMKSGNAQYVERERWRGHNSALEVKRAMDTSRVG
jgi:quercetin dioxygenase-like cupin family protein